MAGLNAMKDFDVVHRDLKLENILIHYPNLPSDEKKAEEYKKNFNILERPEEFVLKIADFGFAKRVSDQEGTKTQCGTPITMAPEVILGKGKMYRNKVDIWSVGCLFFQLITG